MRYRQPFMALLFLFTLASALCGDERLLSQVHRGEDFLKRQVRLQHDYLSCQSSGTIQCPLYQAGQVFLAAFITEALQEQVDTVKTILLKTIQKQQRNQSWGYAINAPTDADDSAFALQAWSQLDPQFKTQKLKAYLESMRHFYYVAEWDAYTTFISDKNRSVLPAITPNTQNNSGIHPEVNANIAYLLRVSGQDARFLDVILLSFQAQDGSWYGYFYPSVFYATYFFARYFCGLPNHGEPMLKTIKFLAQQQHPDGSFGKSANVYATALATRTWLECDNGEVATRIERGISYLLKQQAVDGSWRADKEVIWEYKYADWPDSWWRAYDEQNMLATALVVKTLKSYLHRARL